MDNCRWEKLAPWLYVCSSPEFSFSADAFFLAGFCSPRRGVPICDLGTGCGILSLLIARDFQPSRIDAVDLQPQALELLRAAVNRSKLETPEKPLPIFPIEADLRLLWPEAPLGKYGLVVCNPPYFQEGRGKPSSSRARDTAHRETMCTLDEICRAASRLLEHGGRFCLCHRPERLPDVLCAMRRYNLEPKRLQMVCKTEASPPWLILAEGRHHGKPSLQILPPLIMEKNGVPTPETTRLYYHQD